MFDWQGFLSQHNIPFAASGANVKKGNIVIHCPMCGGDDPSLHLGIELSTGRWGCWRRDTHRGVSAKWLIRALLNCSLEEAAGIAGEDQTTADSFQSLSQRAANLFGNDAVKPEAIEAIEFDQGIRPLKSMAPNALRFVEYLEDRKFDQVNTLCEYYDLRYATWGDWRDRLILPVYENNKLIGWTGRAIGNAELRYKAHPKGNIIKQTVFNHDAVVKGGKWLVVVEGPMDALKLDFYGKEFGVRAVAIMGTSATAQQLAAIIRLAIGFGRVGSLLDEDALSSSVRLSAKLGIVGAESIILDGYDDPGSLTPYQIYGLVKRKFS